MQDRHSSLLWPVSPGLPAEYMKLLSSPDGIWMLAGREEVCGSRGATVTGCGAAGLGTVITTVLPGTVAWFMLVTWLRAGFVTCSWLLALTTPEVVTFATTTTWEEDVWGRGTATWTVAATGSTLEAAAAVGCGAAMAAIVTGTCDVFTSPFCSGNFWAPFNSLFAAIN